MKKRWIKAMTMLVSLLFSGLFLLDAAYAQMVQSDIQKTIQWHEEKQAFYVKLDGKTTIQNEKSVYIALLMDASYNMNRLRDIWDSEGGWISRKEAVEFSTKAVLNQIFDLENMEIQMGVWAFHTETVGLTDGFQPLYSDEKSVNTCFEMNNPQFFMNDYALAAANQKPDYSKGLQAAYEALADAPEEAETYVLMITANDDIEKARTQQYAAALKAPKEEVIGGMGAGRDASIWTVLIGHENNVNPTQWQTEYLTTGVDFSAGNDDGFEWAAWQNGEPNAISSRRNIVNAEPHLISLSLTLNPSAYASFPANASLHDAWDFYKTNLMDRNALENGQDAHYYYSMSTVGDDGVQLNEDNGLEHHFGYQFTHGLKSLQSIAEQFAEEVGQECVATLEAKGGDLYDSTIFSLLDSDTTSAVQLQVNGQPVPNQMDWSRQGQIDWTMKNISSGDSFTLEYFLTLNVPHEEVQYQPVGESGSIDYSDGMRFEIPAVMIPKYIAPQNPENTGSEQGGNGGNQPNVPVTTPPANNSGQNGGPSGSSNTNHKPSAPTESPKGTGSVLNTVIQEDNHSPVILQQGDRNLNLTSMAAPPTTPNRPNPNPAPAPSPYTKEVPAEKETKKEKLDAKETRRMKGKSLTVSVAKAKVYAAPENGANVSLYLNEGRQFKIAGATPTYYMIQYKRKDNKVRKGYIEKTDVSLAG